MKLSQLSEEAIVNAEKEVGKLHHEFIGTEHLLLGLLGPKNKSEIASQLKAEGVDISEARRAVERISGDKAVDSAKPITLTPRAKKVLAQAQSEAEKEGKEVIDPKHILQALIVDREGVAARVLENAKVKPGHKPSSLFGRILKTVLLLYFRIKGAFRK